MIIQLPHVEAFDTLHLPEDFEERIIASFAKFTEGTNKIYTYEDKLSYLDNLRKRWLHKNIGGSDAVKELILKRCEFELDEYGDLPDRDDFWDLEFIGCCYDEGRRTDFRDLHYENNHLDNDKTMRVIAKIIQIVMNWEA